MSRIVKSIDVLLQWIPFPDMTHGTGMFTDIGVVEKGGM